MEQIKEQFKSVIRHSQGIEEPQIDELFDRWYAAKQKFINIFGNKLIYEHGKVSFPLDPQQKHTKIANFIDMITNTYENYDLADFIWRNADSFFDNLVSVDSIWQEKGIKKGMKLIKAFKFFEEDKEVLYQLQSEASRIIQEDKVEGILCFSVHPLDFLSVSCNAHKWRSCHALDGEYRAGNLSYMVDKVTMICYVKSEKDAQIVGFPDDLLWNSKKWRVLLYLNPTDSMIFAGKQYPFSSQEGLNYVRDILLTRLQQFNRYWHPWTQAISTITDPDINMEFCLDSYYALYQGTRIMELEDIIKDTPGALQFNDVLNSSCYKPYYTGRVRHFVGSSEAVSCIEVGDAVKCLRCGKDYITHHEIMTCDECERLYGPSDSSLFRECTCCGARVSTDLIYYDVNDDPICPECQKQHYVICPECGELCHTNELKYDRETGRYLCNLCHEEDN